jgi:putative transposase
LTFSCYRRMPLLMNDSWRQLFGESIDTAITSHSCRTVGYVLMPEHVHLLIQPTRPDFRIDLFLKALKAPFSSRIKRLLVSQDSPLLGRLTVRERPGVHRFRFWQEGGGYDRNIHTSSAITSAINYIHENPVRRGLCDRPIEWRWSSARHYSQDGQGGIKPDRPPTVHGLTWDFLG